jgi:hypothetical protein
MAVVIISNSASNVAAVGSVTHHLRASGDLQSPRIQPAVIRRVQEPTPYGLFVRDVP